MESLWEREYLINAWVDAININETRWVVVAYPEEVKGLGYQAVILNRVCGSTKIYNKDYEVLKLQAILKAKELGWKINKNS